MMKTGKHFFLGISLSSRVLKVLKKDWESTARPFVFIGLELPLLPKIFSGRW